MIPVAPPNHYSDIIYVAGIMKKRLGDYRRTISDESRRLRRETRKAFIWVGAALLGFSIETAILAFALAGLSFNVLGHTVSGTIFFGVVPMAFAYFHIRVHEYGDEGLRRLFSNWGRVGLILMIIAASGLLGVSFIVGAFDSLIAASGDGGGWSGDNGGDTLQSQSDYDAWSGVVGGLAGLPMVLFGIALIFSLVIAMNVVSWCVGKALLSLNIIMTTVDRSGDLDELDEVHSRVDAFMAMARAEKKAAATWPDDPNLAFARAYFDHVLGHLNRLYTGAMMAFRSYEAINYVRFQGGVPEAELIKSLFDSHQAAVKHLDGLQDHARPHNTLMLLEVNPAAPKPLSTPSSKG